MGVCVCGPFFLQSLHMQKSDVDLMRTKLRRLEEENSRKDRQIEQLLDPSRVSCWLGGGGGAPAGGVGATGSPPQTNGGGGGLNCLLSSCLHPLTTGHGFCSDSGREKA